RERVRSIARSAVPRRRGRVVVARTLDEFRAALRDDVVDAAVVDLGAPGDASTHAACVARDYPSVAFVGIAPFRAADAPRIAERALLELADVLAEGIDDALLRPLVAARGFSARFALALREPPPTLGLDSPLQRSAWRAICAHAGRAVRSSALSSWLGVTREHLSRSFSSAGVVNLKRAMDLVRVLAAAELAKNPGYDTRDVARVLGFASVAHLSRAATRTAGATASSLSRLRGVDLLDRFAKGRGRSRG
ncbi:MAG: helix-turn-helix domain-containing protein, partial [Gemmatimonadaceae bacterium]